MVTLEESREDLETALKSTKFLVMGCVGGCRNRYRAMPEAK